MATFLLRKHMLVLCIIKALVKVKPDKSFELKTTGSLKMKCLEKSELSHVQRCFQILIHRWIQIMNTNML